MNLQTAQRLYTYRKNHGLSQEELAVQIGVSRQAVSKWERGEACPDTDNLIALAQLYGVTLNELILGESPISPDHEDHTESPEKKAEETPAAENDVHISFADGIHVRDTKRGGHVHVGWQGAHVSTPKTEVHVDKNGVFVEENGETHLFHKNPPLFSSTYRFFIRFPYPVLTTLLYLLFGCLHICGGWAYGWIVFLTIPLYYSLVKAIARRQPSRFAYPILVLIVYLALGFSQELWHPLWLLFLTIPLYVWVCECIEKK